MKVLWITNILFPEVKEMLCGSKAANFSGGWMLGMAESLVSTCKVDLVVASVSSLVKEVAMLSGNNITYYVIPLGKGNLHENNEYNKYWRQVYSEVHPDVVHVYGTEAAHGLAYINECGADNVVLSIQGLLTSCAKYYCAGLSQQDIYLNITPHDIIRGTVKTDQLRFRKRSKYEFKMLNLVKHVIGRTSWDKAMVMSINPLVKYHFCNEVLRSEFYCSDTWKYETCNHHTIFVSQAGYPLKGFHQVLKALPLILSKYPDTVIKVAGTNITECSSIPDLLHFTGYGLYLKRMIRKLSLIDKIKFLGPLSADEMKNEYLKCNVFLCPSSIENSPNSLAEAQILGVPCVASYVGGIPDMMCGDEQNLYRFDDVELLAQKVINVFRNGAEQSDMRINASVRHDRTTNTKELLSIYNEIQQINQ